MAGPFLGEFGWELLCWQAKLRAMSKQYSQTYVLCRSGHEVLYDDFAETNAIPKPASPQGPRDRGVHVIGPNKELVAYDPVWTMDLWRAKGFMNQDFIRFGGNEPPAKVVLIHARSRGHGVERNWFTNDYAGVVAGIRQSGYTVAAVGLKGETVNIEADEDWRGLPLSELVEKMAMAKCIVGPSSGPMHLAALCECPQVVFSSEENRIRYSLQWNPFGTSFVFPEGGWDPTTEAVLESFHWLTDQPRTLSGWDAWDYLKTT
jgi:hypothetical protein